MNDFTGGVDVTLLVCTFNRSTDLRELLQTAVSQKTNGTFTYEILVVDNNSTDDTRATVESFITDGHRNLRYILEPRQGKSFALNTGLKAAAGKIFTITDDDFILPPDWVSKIVEAFAQYPGASFVSGKVHPAWQGPVPSWLTRDHWAAVALADYGDEPFFTDENHQICLLACSFRKDDVRAVGGYRGDLGVSRNRIGGVEDLEILQRLWHSGRKGIYQPHIGFQHKVQAARLSKAYHRRWHMGHGRFYANLRDENFERSSVRFFDVPGHVYRQLASSILKWIKCTMLLKSDAAFSEETKLRFLFGFLLERQRMSRRPQAGA